VLPGDLLPRFAAPFRRLGLPCMITGGAAAIVYGEPRLTNDLDLVVAMAPTDATRVAEALADGGGDRHLRDIRRMLDRALVPLDREALDQFVRQLDLTDTWHRVLEWTEPT
jgi:hypothetical protein